jgi:hypothetical protein
MSKLCDDVQPCSVCSVEQWTMIKDVNKITLSCIVYLMKRGIIKRSGSRIERFTSKLITEVKQY